MTRDELRRRLTQERVDPDAYDLEETGKEEAYCIERSDFGWTVFYRERGNRNYEHTFENESVALNFLMKEILQDPTTKRRPLKG